MSEKRTPEIRFKGFEDEWELCKLGEIVERIARKNSDLISELPLTISSEFGLVDQRTYFNNRIASGDVSNYYLILNGEFAYNRSSSDGYPFGAVKRLDLYEEGVLSTLYIIFSLKDLEKINSDFLAVFFDTNKWHKEIEEKVAEGARNHGLLNITVDDFFDMRFLAPRKDFEQLSISLYTKTLDNLISLQETKFKRLKILKISMLEKMFPKGDEIVPEIRFAGFSGEWEKKKLGEYLAERDVRTSEGELLSVTINQGVKRFSELGRHDNSSDDKSKYKKVYVGDIAYNSMRMWQGASGHSDYEGIVSPAYTVLSPNEGVDTKFFAYLFKSDDMIRTFQIHSQGITSDTWNLKYPTLKEIVVAKPQSIEEQKGISSVLEELDRLITFHQQKLEKLKNIKAACLEKMFV